MKLARHTLPRSLDMHVAEDCQRFPTLSWSYGGAIFSPPRGGTARGSLQVLFTSIYKRWDRQRRFYAVLETCLCLREGEMDRSASDDSSEEAGTYALPPVIGGHLRAPTGVPCSRHARRVRDASSMCSTPHSQLPRYSFASAALLTVAVLCVDRVSPLSGTVPFESNIYYAKSDETCFKVCDASGALAHTARDNLSPHKLTNTH